MTTEPAETAATTEGLTPAPPRPLQRTGALVDARIANLQGRFLRQRRDPAAVAALARLRRGVGKPPAELLDVMEYTHADEFGAEQDEPTSEERALHVAVTLYALHQQSCGEPMHRRGQGLGRALRALHPGDDASLPDPVRRRFQVLGTADSFTEVTHHLRGAVQVLRAGGIPLDYGRLADQLVTWQRPHGPSAVRLQWGREFYRTRRPPTPIVTET